MVVQSVIKLPARVLKRILTPAVYSEWRHYSVKRIPRLINQFTGRDLWYRRQIRRPCERIGSMHHGKYLCTDGINRNNVVYSFGIGQEISFDLTLIERFGVEVHAFDPTPLSIAWVRGQDLPQEFNIYEYGLAAEDGFVEFHHIHSDMPDTQYDYNFSLLQSMNSGRQTVKRRVFRLSTIMQKLGHTKIDILKMDVEGAEYAIIDDLLTAGIEIHQIAVEFHHRFDGIGLEKTRRAIKALNQNGFKILYVGPEGFEYSFIRE